MKTETLKISLSRGAFALVDAADYPTLSAHKWSLSRARLGYAVRKATANGKAAFVKMHNAVLAPPPGLEVDHINGDTLDNRRCNLRLATRRQNIANRRPTASSGFKGVYRHKSGWAARIRLQGRLQYLGTFPSPDLAARAYDAAASAEWGEFAFQNFGAR